MAGREAWTKAAADALGAQGAAMARLHMAMAGKLGLGTTDARVCDLLLRRGPLMAGEIGLATGLTSGSVTALIGRLEALGLVRRVRDDGDRRRVLVYADAAAAAPGTARLGRSWRRSTPVMTRRRSRSSAAIC